MNTIFHLSFRLKWRNPFRKGQAIPRFRFAALGMTMLLCFLFYFSPVLAQTDPTIIYRDTSYKGSYVNQSIPDPITLTPGETKEVTVTFKNTGKSTWFANGKHYVSAYTVSPKYKDSTFADKNWPAANNPGRISQNAKPGQMTTLTITLHAPTRPATYKEEFTLAAENATWIKGTYFYFLITVQKPETQADDVTASAVASSTTDAEATSTVSDDNAPPRELISEPTIRVGLYTSKEPVQFSSSYAYDVLADDEIKGTISPGERVDLSFDGSYHLRSSDLSVDSSGFIRLVPHDNDSYFTLLNYTHHVSNRGTNYNIFRGVLEYRVNNKTGEPVVINELPLDEYVAGVAETGNDSAPEYIKALMIAARTYAYVRMGPTTENHLYDVVPTATDQVYLGYYSEVEMPNVVQAVQDTRGIMVTYQGNPVMTNYFGHSDGKTRDGAANKPWLKSVKAVYDTGLAMYGHGVGMSAHDASQHAVKDGWTYSDILTYYYTGVRIEKIY